MSHMGGLLDSGSVIDGSYFDWETRFIPFTVTILNADVQAAVEEPSCRSYQFKIEVEDVEEEEVTEIAVTTPSGTSSYVKSVTVQRNVESQTDSFSVAFANAYLVSPRITGAMQGVLAQDIRKRIRVYVGMVIAGTLRWFRIFTGVPMSPRNEEWTEKGSGMTINGFSVTFVLTRFPGNVSDYTGTLTGLVMDLFDQAGLPDFIMEFDDRLIETAIDVVADTIEDALADLFAVDREVQWFADANGIITLGEPKEDATPVFTYRTGANGIITKLSPNHDPSQVITQANVVGGDEAGSTTVADVALIARFGTHTGSASSAILVDADAAEEAGDAVIAKSERNLARLGVHAAFNPVLEPGMAIEIDTTPSAQDPELSGILTVLQVTFQLEPAGMKMNAISGELDREV